MCIYAIKQDWEALKIIKDHTEKICLEAVKQNWGAIKIIKNQTEKNMFGSD